MSDVLHYVYLVEEAVDGGNTTTNVVFSSQEEAEKFIEGMGQWRHYYSVRKERLMGRANYVKQD